MHDFLSILTDPASTDAEVLTTISELFSRSLKETPEARAWLAKRGLLKDKALSDLGLGFADRQLGNSLPKRDNKVGRATRDRLIRLGIMRSNGRPHLAGSLTLPVVDKDGNVTAILGKRIGKALPGSIVKQPVAGDEAAIWNIACLSEPGFDGTLVVCRNMEEALACRLNGLPQVTWFRDDTHLNAATPLIREKGVKKLLLLNTPADFSDIKGFDVSRIHVPFGKGLWYYLKKSEYPKAALRELLRRDIRAFPDPEIPEPDTVPASESAESDVKEPPAMDNGELRFEYERRSWRVRGLSLDETWATLKVNLRLDLGDRCHVDLVDLYSSKQRRKYINDAADETRESESVIKADLGRILLELEECRETLVKQAESCESSPVTAMTGEEREEAMELLSDPDMLERIVSDFRVCGLVGEDANSLFGYIAATSRKLDDPVSVIIQSSSSAGKSSLMEAIVGFMPPEELVSVTAMTAQSLYYFGRSALKHKIVAVSEGEGIDRAGYALKLLQSEKRLSIVSTGRDSKTGRQVTHRYEVEGPIQTIVTTTASEVDEELQNRSVVLTVGEDRSQTRAIQELQRQRQTLEGILQSSQRDRIICKHRNAQRLLRPVMVVNPFAANLTFDDSRVRYRRDHVKYLGVIRAITFLHQFRRRIKTVSRFGKIFEYVETTEEDVHHANNLMAAVLARSMDDLAPQTRKLLEAVRKLATEVAASRKVSEWDIWLTRRSIREYTGWNDTRLRKHLSRLASMEYLLVHRRGMRFIEYQVLPESDGLPAVQLTGPVLPEVGSRTL